MIYGLLGKKLGHSYSPEIHEAFGRYSYRLIELKEDQLEEFLKSPEIGGLNVTIPYKEAVVKYCSRLTPLAERIGAVNTIYREQDETGRPGQLVGDNTDYDGFLALLRKAGLSLSQKKGCGPGKRRSFPDGSAGLPGPEGPGTDHRHPGRQGGHHSL
jgi:Shikimate 5-dehydrogenase